MATPYTIEDIVDVIISIGDRPITQAGFTTPLILVDSDVFLPERVRAYTDPDDLITDGFLTTDSAYIIATKIMSGDFAPREFKVGLYDSTVPETALEGLQEVVDVDNDWFYLICDSHDADDQEALAGYAEANKKVYATSTQDPNAWSAATTDIISVLQALQYDNTIVMADVAADTEWPEAGIVGAMASLVPGASTLHGKTLPGVTLQTFSRTQANFITGKNGSIYSMIGGVGFFTDGKMVSGRFFDVVTGALYLEARMQEDVFAFIKRKSDLGQKVPYTDPGVDMIVGVMSTRLTRAIADGFIAASPPFSINPPLVEEVPENDRANRLLPDIPFEATLQGAIHRTIIRGYLKI